MSSKLSLLHAFKPGVNKIWLQLTAGLIWLGVGALLSEFAFRWLKNLAFSSRLWTALAGYVLAGAIYLFGFSRLAKKNIRRIVALDGERVCLFAFQAAMNYPLVAFMIALGIYLRLYSPFPKSMLAILYLGIGGGLFLASLHYFAQVWRTLRLSLLRRPA